jgi:hypothetical protein
MNQKLKRTRQILVVLILIAAVEGFSSCEKYAYTIPKVNPDIPVSFKTDIQPIFDAKCITCHNGAQFPDLRTGKSYNALSKAGFITPPGETSTLYIQITTESAHIPRTSATEKDLILNWINQGALNN